MSNLSWQKTVTLKSGKQVVLRYPRPDDAQGLMEYINPIIEENTFIMHTTPKTWAEEVQYVQSCIEDIKSGNGIFIYALFDGQIVGVVDVRRERDKMAHVGLLGITVAKDFRGDGLGKILMTEATAQAKEVLGLEAVHLTCFISNAPAIELYKKIGFVEYGHFPKALQQNGKKVDQLSFYKEL